ncbi:MAG: hypothetical protein WAW39_15995 [Prosthecobacter sp.]|uniref:hypothetical protein n=1 Tax=Prosthecobacter sp. TaxID=1965333 RepID=UPI003BB09232
MNRHKAICLAILEVLENCGENALPQSTLHDHINDRIAQKARTMELQAALDDLSGQGDSVMDAIDKLPPGNFGDDEARWFITKQGRVLLRQK